MHSRYEIRFRELNAPTAHEIHFRALYEIRQYRYENGEHFKLFTALPISQVA
jgi:hypothetical protein